MQCAKEVHACIFSFTDGSKGRNNCEMSDAVYVDKLEEESTVEVMFDDEKMTTMFDDGKLKDDSGKKWKMKWKKD